MLPADRSFALMMLRDPAKGRAPLAKEVGTDDANNVHWQTKFATGFIEKVTVTNLKKQKGQLKSGRLTIRVTHPAWIQHVSPGDRWDSRAWPAASKYAKCAPIVPGSKNAAQGAKVATSTSGDSGFVTVPTKIWFKRATPRLVTIPAYGESAYLAGPKLKNPSPEALGPLLGRAVRSKRSNIDGALVKSGPDQYAVVRLTESSCGVRGPMRAAHWDDLQLLELKPNARLAGRLTDKRIKKVIPR